MTAVLGREDRAATGTQNIRLVDVEKRFGQQSAVKDLNLEILDRELLVVLGPSGSGKTTVLNLLAGLVAPTAGEIYFGKERVTDTPAEERNISMVFQSIALYPNLNVQDNILFALKLAKVPKDVQEQRVRDITRLLAIEGYLGRRVHELSGGERQRVAIAKALVKRPELFLLDEPFSSLDAELRRELRGELVRIRRELETTMLFVTHDQEEALSIADRIAVMNRGELVQIGGPVEIYERPVNMWVAKFVGPYPINLIEVEWEVENGVPYARMRFGRLPVDQDVFDRVQQASKSSRSVLGMRPEFTRLSATKDADRTLPVTVYTRQHLGNEVLYEVRADGHDLRAVAPVSQNFGLGDQAYLDFAWDRVLWFDLASEKTVVTSPLS
jgi:multiple sugar transport system ATP-binding protein